jgi:hypothetical protein
MITSAVGALVTSILTIAELTGWPYEIVPIVVQTSSGVIAAWMRFYDFPKRMEAVINIKHTSNDTRERMQKSAAIDDQLWEQYCAAVKSLDAVLTPEERDSSHVQALKFMKRERIREAQLHQLVSLDYDELLSQKNTKRIMRMFDNGSDSSDPPLSPTRRHRSSSLDVMPGFSNSEPIVETDFLDPMYSRDGGRDSPASKRSHSEAFGEQLEAGDRITLVPEELESDDDQVVPSVQTPSSEGILRSAVTRSETSVI